MKNPSFSLLFLVFFLCVTIPMAPANAELTKAETAMPDYEVIDAYVRSEMERSSSPGLAYAIVHNDKIVHAKAFGIAGPDSRPVTTSTPFILGSVGKTFTALAIRQLVEGGLVDPNTPARTYIPWFRLADEQASSRITIQNLLDHKSGIPTSAGNQLYQLSENYDLETLVKRASSVKLTSTPGTTYEYSNINFLILGLVVERVSNSPYPDYVEEHILKPLEMNRTFLDEDVALKNGLASGYQSWFGLMIPIQAPFPEGMLPAGYAISTIEDMGNYLIAYLNRGEFRGYSLLSQGFTEPPETFRKGLDIYWNDQALDPNIMEGQSGGTLNFNADIQIIPESKWGVVVLMNSRWTLDGLLPSVTAASIANGIACRIKNWPKLPEAPLTLSQWYVAIDLILLTFVAGSILELLGCRKWQRRIRDNFAKNARKIMWSIGIDFLLSASLSILPLLKAYSLDYLLVTLPDIAIGICGVAFVLVMAGVLKLVIVYIEIRNRRLASKGIYSSEATVSA